MGYLEEWDLMIAPSRNLHGKVEITYLKPFEPEFSKTVTTNGTADHTYEDQIANGVMAPDKRWFEIGSAPIGAGFSFISDIPATPEVGWWSDVLSEADGTFLIPPVVTLEYTLRTALAVQVVGDILWNIFPVNFSIEAFNGITSVYTITVVGNTLTSWVDYLAGMSFTSDKVVLTINKINKGNARARIIEFGFSTKDLYLDNTILNINYLEELYYYDGSLPIGAVSADEISITLSDPDARFDPQNINSPIVNDLKKNRRVRAWLGVEESPGNILWKSLGTFYTQNWSVDRANNSATVVARDLLELMRTTVYKRGIFTSTTLYDLFEDVLQDFGLSPADYIIDASFSAIVFPYFWFGKSSHRDALSLLARNSLANITVDRNDVVIIEDTQPSTDVMFAYTDSTNIFEKRYPLAWTDQVNQVLLQVSSYDYNSSSNIFVDNTVITLAAGEIIYKEYLYNVSPIKDNVVLTLTAGVDIVYNIENTYSWGCLVKFTNNGGVSENITQVSIAGQNLVLQSTVTVSSKNQEQIDDAGLISQEITEMSLIQDIAYAQSISDTLLQRFGLQSKDVSLDNRGHISLAPGSKVQLGTDYYMLLRQELRYNGGLESTVEAKII